MARALSQDLRGRVINAALGGMSARTAAVGFEINNLDRGRVGRSGTERQRKARPPAGHRGPKLDAHHEFLLGLIDEMPDITCPK